jgi:transcription termination factor Rho
MLGVLEIAGRGSGFLRRRETGYLPSNGDVHVGERIIRQYGLRAGDEIAGETRPGGKGRGPTLERVTSIHGHPPDQIRTRPEFTRLSAVHPNELIRLEARLARSGQVDHTNRVIDLLSPLGKGQRALIVAPAKAGKTMVLQAIAEGANANYPDADLLILLVDERPEEVFEMEAAGVGEVIASSFDNPASQHVAVAELTLERARRRVELGEDVVLKVDPSKGGGSLTIIATALVDTGSKMDQVIFEEFKGTGNSELVLSRELAERRVFPAIDLVASATRREELLLDEPTLAASRALRQRIAGMTPINAMNDLLVDFKRYKTNAELVKSLNGG